MFFPLIVSFALILSFVFPTTLALPADNSTAYFQSIQTAFNQSGLNYLWNAITVANTTQDGQNLLGGLYSDDSYTLYGPVDSAWESSGLTNPPADEDIVSLLSYHIVKATLNSSTDIAPSRQHTVAFTELRSSTVDLPGDQTQVIVIETAENATAGSSPGNTTILIRGDNWNASSTAEQFRVENLWIQPIYKILAVPSPLLKTLSQSGLALSANLGATSAINLISSLGLNDTFSTCHGCTFFVPVNDAFTNASTQSNFTSLNSTQQTAVLKNHILNGTVLYSPDFAGGKAYITAAGEPLLYLSADSADYVSVGGYRAKILRSDIPISNGVVHLIDTVLVETLINPGEASRAVASASSAATGRTTTTNVIGVGGATSTATATATSTVTQSKGAALPFANVNPATIKTSLLAIVLGGLWM